MNTPKVSIIIPTARAKDSRFKLLESLSIQTMGNFEVIVVFRTLLLEDKRELQKKYPKLKLLLVEQKHPGLVSARNTGIDYATGEITVFTDDDITPVKNWLKEINLSFNNTQVGGVSGPTIIPKGFLDNRDLLSFFEKKIQISIH